MNTRGRLPLAFRFMSKIDKLPSGCWQWTGYVTRNGYGVFWDGERRWYAHRWVYTTRVGAIPNSLTIDHLCRNRACVNPSHLEAVTLVENVMRGEGPCARLARQTRCKRGHELSGENIYVDSKGYRRCKTCDAECHRQYVESGRIAWCSVHKTKHVHRDGCRGHIRGPYKTRAKA